MTHLQRKIKKIFLLAGLFVFISFFFGASANVNAQSASTEKIYYYQSISDDIKVNQDSTVNVEEKQTYNYVGEFHAGWRDIPLTKIDAITDISVIDGETGQALIYSSGRLDKLNPSSWGKFTYFRENGNQNIEWYYNLKDAAHTWILKYKIHGSLEFNKNSDRFYWNIFTSYDVPVLISDISVSLPQKLSEKNITFTAYRTQLAKTISKSFDSATGAFTFSSEDFSPKESFTVDVTWPKGIISQSSFWLDFIKIYYGIILSFFIILAGIIIGFIRWLKTEKLPESRRTIVPQYEPPEHLKPAMAEIITKEKLTTKGLTATVVDLAIRGYVRIEEDKSKNFNIKFWLVIFIQVPFLFILVFLLVSMSNDFSFYIFLPVILFVIAIISSIFGGKKTVKNYTISKNKDYESDSSIEDYEKEYLQIILGSKGYFSTREIKKNPTQQQEFYILTQKLKENIYKETELDTQAFDVGPSREKKKLIVWYALTFITSFIVVYFRNTLSANNQLFILISVTIATTIALWAFIKYEARLSQKGIILKEDWLGFKLYLETAERYRMQNLTPDMFEKYLPYAMVFGVEKKWAKNFEAMNLPAPSWYGSAAVYGSIGFSGGNSSSFSPTGFSSSFSSSFSSAFGSSGAGGGGGGGGGGAGGGGGGGGGGAS